MKHFQLSNIIFFSESIEQNRSVIEEPFFVITFLTSYAITCCGLQLDSGFQAPPGCYLDEEYT